MSNSRLSLIELYLKSELSQVILTLVIAFAYLGACLMNFFLGFAFVSAMLLLCAIMYFKLAIDKLFCYQNGRR